MKSMFLLLVFLVFGLLLPSQVKGHMNINMNTDQILEKFVSAMTEDEVRDIWEFIVHRRGQELEPGSYQILYQACLEALIRVLQD